MPDLRGASCTRWQKLAADCIKEMEVIDYADLGMEAVYRIRVKDNPAFVVINDKGEYFFATVIRPIRFD